MPVVTALRATKRGGIALHVDGDYVCTVSEALVAARRLYAGKELGGEEVAALRDEALAGKALAHAHRLLAHRARSRAEVAARLRDKPYSADIVAQTVNKLVADGLLDDAEFARAFVSDRRRLSGWGRERIVRELLRLGVAGADIDAALGPEDESDEGGRALAALQRRGPARPPLEAAKRRAYTFLVRRGFSTHAAYRAVATWVAGGDERPTSERKGAVDGSLDGANRGESGPLNG